MTNNECKVLREAANMLGNWKRLGDKAPANLCANHGFDLAGDILELLLYSEVSEVLHRLLDEDEL